MRKLFGKIIAVLADQGFNEKEVTKHIEALRSEGAEIILISSSKKVKGWNGADWGKDREAEVLIQKADPMDYNGLLIPGGEMSSARLKVNQKVIAFVDAMLKKHKPVAVVSEGLLLLSNINLKGRRITSYPSMRDELAPNEAQWVDEMMVVDENLLTAKTIKDIGVFNQAMIDLFEKEEEFIIRRLNETPDADVRTDDPAVDPGTMQDSTKS